MANIGGDLCVKNTPSHIHDSKILTLSPKLMQILTRITTTVLRKIINHLPWSPNHQKTIWSAQTRERKRGKIM